MIKKKGKQKYILYLMRRQRKILRARQRHKKKTFNSKGHCIPQEEHFLGRDYISVINHLDHNNFAMPNFFPKKVETIHIPEIFSISENAENVIKLLRKVYTIIRSQKTSELIFDHTKCSNLELSASTIMDIIVLAVCKYREREDSVLSLEGLLPHNDTVRNILLASGLPYHLHAEHGLSFDEKHVERFKTIKGQHDKYANKADGTSTKLMLYFNRCLKTQGMELNEEGKRLLSRILGEVISNCEIHGGETATWYTQGHYQMKDNNSFGEMQILFLTLGDTIYEGLLNNSSSETNRKLQHILNRQRKNMNSKWDKEMIFTVFALQEGISRLRDENIEGYEGRGSGTVSMIEMFNDIGKCKNGLTPQMTIVSGKTLIKFTDKYKMEEKEFNCDIAFGTGVKRIIAFNHDNDIYSPPDANNVIKMSEYFPGTVISLKFYLDNRYITNKKN